MNSLCSTQPRRGLVSFRDLASLLLLTILFAHVLRANAAGTNDDALWRPRLVTPAIVALDDAANRQ